jgi:hypothetical protein
MRATVVGLAVLLCLSAACARAGSRKVVIAVLNHVTWHDLLADDVEAPTLRRLIAEGAVGVMCPRTARGAGTGGAYLTIGAGARAAAQDREQAQPSPEGQAFQRGERVDTTPQLAGQCYQSRTGQPAGGSAIVHLGIGELVRENTSGNYQVKVGLLGSALRQGGLRAACVGNADTPLSVHREAAAIAMDERGLVPVGDVGRGLLKWDPSLPYLYTTDPGRMDTEVAGALGEADLVVVELGETARAEEYAEVVTPEAAKSVRKRAIERSDRLLSQVLARLPGEGWLLLVVTPSVRAPGPQAGASPAGGTTIPEEQFAALAPIIMFAPDAEAGLLTSASTRRPGVVVNTDIAPTVLSYFGLPTPPEAAGRPMSRVQTHKDHERWLKEQVGRQDALEASRRYVFRWLPAHVAAAMWAAAFLLALGGRAPRWARSLVRGLLVVGLAAPAAGLLAALAALPSLQATAVVIGGAVVLALVSCWLTAWRVGYALPAVLVVGVLAYDLVFGQQMLQWSPLSYSVAAGARFYGIGNELAGALLGGALVAAASLVPSRVKAWWGERLVVALVLAGLVVMAGHPRLGANFGMAAGCAVGFAVFALYLWRERPSWRDAALVFWIAFGVVGVVVLVDVFREGSASSHVGMLAAQVRAMGWQPIWQAAARKLAMNWLLVRTSPWTDAAAAAVGLLAVVAVVRPQAAREAADGNDWLRPAVVACVAGALGSFLLNDSGVVAAAFVLLYGAGVFAYLGLAEPTAGADAPARQGFPLA